ncbi:hypothetical protein JTE90_017494 [Oedothorax gibbosus]|uniref:Uncharacterized protein n=1 Tax=Oedothorax gibbosus TaxID=931172 RepID=A0AAV6UCV6_9ARAC|nr:hypothetical protein JTE90_017494 [Oedothorax gibbosus]
MDIDSDSPELLESSAVSDWILDSSQWPYELAIHHLPHVKVFSRRRPNDFAAVAIDRDVCVVVMNTLWFQRSIHTPDWENEVLSALKHFEVYDIFTHGFCMPLKKTLQSNSLFNQMNIKEITLFHELLYPCKKCQSRTCAFTKAFLLWKKQTKREECNLEH